MAIKPEPLTDYCDLTSGARIEWQNPDRDELEKDWTWNGYTATKTPIRLVYPASTGDLIESITITPGGSVATASSFVKNKYYTFVVSGVIVVSSSVFADGCFEVKDGSPTPSDRLKTNDEQFINMFQKAGQSLPYEPISHQYSVGYIGNDAPVMFSLSSGGQGSLQIDIYPNEYQMKIFHVTQATETLLFESYRDRPFENLNLACGGECPSRTSFSCECSGDRSCYWDNQKGTITKIFQGSANP